jgi:hypothetical protein
MPWAQICKRHSAIEAGVGVIGKRHSASEAGVGVRESALLGHRCRVSVGKGRPTVRGYIYVCRLCNVFDIRALDAYPLYKYPPV